MAAMATPFASLEWGSVHDYRAAAGLMTTSWAQNRESPLEYTPEFLESFFAYPGSLPAITPALYEGGRLAAFVGGVPRIVRLHGATRRLLLMTFFTVAPEWKGKGVGRAVWAECLHRARAAGYDGALHYCVDGNRSNEVTAAAARAAGYHSRRILSIRYLMRLLRPPQQPYAASEPDVDAFLAAAALLPAEIPLARVWTAAEAHWQCSQRTGALYENAGDGVLTGYTMTAADANRTPCVFIEDILWGTLAPEPRIELLQRFLARAAGTARMAVVPCLEYADMTPFTAAAFRRSPRLLHAYLTSWTGGAGPDVNAMYTDVL
jgi:GNAT superfamily N-acetyltransferase